jgi:hypothetical protein
MGITQDQANSYITAAQLAAASKNPTNPGRVDPTGDPVGSGIEALFEAAKGKENPWTWVKNNFKNYGLTVQPDQSEFKQWLAENIDWEDIDTEWLTNDIGQNNNAIRVEHPNGTVNMVSLTSVPGMIQQGLIKVQYNGEDSYTLVFTS